MKFQYAVGNNPTPFSYAPVPQWISQIDPMASRRLWAEAFGLFVGAMFLTLLAQVSFRLPGTPVPITGQTFGVTLVSLCWGRKRGFGIVLAYMILGGLGLPVFALGQSGFSWGPTSGYLIGMCFSSLLIGSLADRNVLTSWIKTLFVTMLGSSLVFLSGALVLSLFLPLSNIWLIGVLPFLPGDLVKNILATTIFCRLRLISGKRP